MKAKRSKALVPTNGCPQCGMCATRAITAVQPALVRHGGSRRTTLRWCERCDWSLVSEVSEERP